ncbi:MAG: M48 family metallopeptidase [Minisyncoccia bacterium]
MTLLVASTVWCLGIALTNTFPLIFTIAAIFAIQATLLNLRQWLALQPAQSESDVQSRIGPTLIELCAKADCSIPRVKILDGAIAAAVTSKDGRPVLIISTKLLRSVGDPELRAILAHEVAHVADKDLKSPLRRVPAVFVGVVAALGYWSASKSHSYDVVPLAWALLPLTMTILMRSVGFSFQKRELEADRKSAILTGDPQALIRALTTLDAMYNDQRLQVFGRRPWSWFYLPFSSRPTTHPLLATRVEALNALSSEQLNQVAMMEASSSVPKADETGTSPRRGKASFSNWRSRDRARRLVVIAIVIGIALVVAIFTLSSLRQRPSPPTFVFVVPTTQSQIASTVSVRDNVKLAFRLATDEASSIYTSFTDCSTARCVSQTVFNTKYAQLVNEFVITEGEVPPPGLSDQFSRYDGELVKIQTLVTAIFDGSSFSAQKALMNQLRSEMTSLRVAESEILR